MPHPSPGGQRLPAAESAQKRGFGPFQGAADPHSHKPWGVKQKNSTEQNRERGEGQRWGPQTGRSEGAKPTCSIPFPAHGQPPPSPQGSGGFTPGFTSCSQEEGNSATSSNPLLHRRKPLHQLLRRARSLLRQSPSEALPNPQAHVSATVQCPRSFYGPVLTAGSKE